MTQSDFFGAVESNLREQVASHMPLPEYNLPAFLRGDGHLRLVRGMVKLKNLKKLTSRDSSAPANIRVYDLVSSKIPFAERLRFRIFAAYAEEATAESYRQVKFLIRKWYQESGWADAASDRPFAGAMVVGSDQTWPKGMRPNADDLPFEHVVFHMLASPHERREFGIAEVTQGDADAGALIFRAMHPETFEERAQRVVDYVERLFRQQDGTVTVERVAEATGMSPVDVSNIFNDMQAKGLAIIRKKDPKRHVGVMTKAESMYVEPGSASAWKRMVSKSQGAWHVQKGFCALLSLGTCGYLLLLVTKALEHILPEQLMQHRWLLYAVGALLGAGCLLLVIRAFIKRI